VTSCHDRRYCSPLKSIKNVASLLNVIVTSPIQFLFLK